MKITLKRLTLAIAGAGLLTVYGCGGGGGSSTASPGGVGSTTFSGIAATGAPLAAGVVVVTDANGATVGTATTDDDGKYSLSFNPASFTAPFVVVVTGKVGDAAATLVSVQATNTSATVNMTPITNAIAALISSTGNPTDLVTNIATEKLNITPAKITTNEQAFRDALAANMTAVGLTPTDNLLSGAFTSKLDKLLDNIHIEVLPSGQIQMSSSAGAAVNDLAATGTQPAAAKTVVLAKGVAPSSANVTDLPAPPGTPIGIDVLEAARLALNACFAVPTPTRSTTTPECSSLVATGYLHDGRDANAEFVTSKLLTDAGNDGMLFQKPEILRQLSTVSGSERLIVRLNAIRTDGLVRSLTTVAANNGTSWELVGNQRAYETFVNGVAAKRVSANDAANTRLETGLNIYVGDNASIASVVVTGPGLPGPGITLKHKSGCDFLGIVDDTLTPPAVSYCASFYRFKSTIANGTTYTGSGTPGSVGNNIYLYGALSDVAMQAIQPLDLYKFVINQSSGPQITYWNRLRSRPLTPTELATVKFVDYSAATIAQMTNATLYTGGAAPTIDWTVPTGGPRPYRAYFFHQAGSDYKGVPYASNSATIPCSGNTDCVNSNAGPAYNTGLMTNIGGYQFQTVARNRYDTQVFTQLAK